MKKYILVCCCRTVAVHGAAAGALCSGGLRRGLHGVEKQGLRSNVTVFDPNPGESGQWPTHIQSQGDIPQIILHSSTGLMNKY